MAVDTSNGALFVLRSGLTQTVEQIAPVTGPQTVLATFDGLGLSYPTIDPRSHTLFAAGPGVIQTFPEIEIVSVDERSGAMTVGPPLNAIVGALPFHHTPREFETYTRAPPLLSPTP